MPESAEVRRTVDYLEKHLVGNQITDWIFVSGKYIKQYPEGYEEFAENLPMTVKTVNCKGKFIYFILENDMGEKYYILHSMMLTGRWQPYRDEQCRWFVETDLNVSLWFRNPRSFATLTFTTDRKVLDAKLSKLGVDILTSEFTLEKFLALVARYPRRNICSFLMDQSVISGCGNYIKAETLYYAKVSPLRKIGQLSDDELRLVYQGLWKIPRHAYKVRGLSMRDYKDPESTKCGQSRDLKIYRKEWATRTKTPDGRITHWNPEIQK